MEETMKADPTIVELNTESVEGPVTIKVDGNSVLKLDFKAKPGLLHVVMPQRYRLKEVPHSSPEIDEGVHYAVLHNHYYLENQRLEDALHTTEERRLAAERLATAYLQGLPDGVRISESTPTMLEVWIDETSKWTPLSWKELQAGMRFRQRDPLTGELQVSEEGHIDYTAQTDAEWRDGIWAVNSGPCETNHVERDRTGTLLTYPPVPPGEERLYGGEEVEDS